MAGSVSGSAFGAAAGVDGSAGDSSAGFCAVVSAGFSVGAPAGGTSAFGLLVSDAGAGGLAGSVASPDSLASLAASELAAWLDSLVAGCAASDRWATVSIFSGAALGRQPSADSSSDSASRPIELGQRTEDRLPVTRVPLIGGRAVKIIRHAFLPEETRKCEALIVLEHRYNWKQTPHGYARQVANLRHLRATWNRTP